MIEPWQIAVIESNAQEVYESTTSEKSDKLKKYLEANHTDWLKIMKRN